MALWVKNTNFSIKRLALKLLAKLNKKYSEVISEIRTQVSFSLIKSSLLCLRGSRTVF